MGQKVVDLAHVGSDRLGEAVRAVIVGQVADTPGAAPLPQSRTLKEGADATRSDGDQGRAQFFQSILELSYLVASADGFAEEERHALATLLGHATEHAVTQDELELHFKDLDESCEMLGRRERLRRAAADFDDSIGRSQALAFATLVAVADGILAEPEHETLKQLGEWLELSESQIDDTVKGVVSAIERALMAENTGG